ncbi:hypothetical protein UlMin_011732 [Ulmus minor]
MSLRYISRFLYQGGMRAIQGTKDQVSKCDSNAVKKIRDSISSSSCKQGNRFSGPIDSSAYKAAINDRNKRAEESLRTVMYLSCWGPN